MKNFRLLTSSKNLHSFGLRGHVLIAADGEAWEIGCADGYLAPVKGKTYGVIRQDADGWPLFASFGWELPRQLVNAPAEVIALVWPKE